VVCHFLASPEGYVPKTKMVAAQCWFDLASDAHQSSIYTLKPQTQTYKEISNLKTNAPNGCYDGSYVWSGDTRFA
jgi:hypothetical protein